MDAFCSTVNVNFKEGECTSRQLHGERHQTECGSGFAAMDNALDLAIAVEPLPHILGSLRRLARWQQFFDHADDREHNGPSNHARYAVQ